MARGVHIVGFLLVAVLIHVSGCGGGRAAEGPPRVVQQATESCPAFRHDGVGPLGPVHLALPDAVAIALGRREVVWHDGRSLRVAALNGSGGERVVHTTTGELGLDLLFDDTAVFVSDGTRTLLRMALDGSAPMRLASFADGPYEAAVVGDAHIYLVRVEACTEPSSCAEPLVRVPKHGGAPEALQGVPPRALPLSATRTGLLLTANERGSDDKTIAVVWHWSDALGLELLGRIATGFESSDGAAMIVAAQESANPGEVVVATSYGQIFVLGKDATPRLLKGLRGGIAAFEMTPDHYLVTTQQSYMLQIPRDAVVDHDAGDRAAIVGVAGSVMRAYPGCVCAAYPLVTHPHGGVLGGGSVGCASYPAPP